MQVNDDRLPLDDADEALRMRAVREQCKHWLVIYSNRRHDVPYERVQSDSLVAKVPPVRTSKREIERSSKFRFRITLERDFSRREYVQITRWPIHDVTICIVCQYFSILCLCNPPEMSLVTVKGLVSACRRRCSIHTC